MEPCHTACLCCVIDTFTLHPMTTPLTHQHFLHITDTDIKQIKPGFKLIYLLREVLKCLDILNVKAKMADIMLGGVNGGDCKICLF